MTNYVLARDIVLKAGTPVMTAPTESRRAVPFVSVLYGPSDDTCSEWVMPVDEALAGGLLREAD